ncbi:MAG TPA: alpha/beta hydrolase [Streptomyces sp.]|nr:alpha/beta hydrolase [Streptomyces sp.]
MRTVRLAHEVSGEPGAPPLVLLHALGETAADWSEVTADLSRHWRVYALDLRGHGRSDWPGDYSLEAMRDDVLRFLDMLGLDRVNVIGHSMGGVVAYLLAARYPERVGRLVLEDVPAPFPREPVAPARPGGPLSFDWAVVPAVKGQLDTPDPAWWEGLREITAPTLAVAGGPRSPVPQDGIEQLAEQIPDCRVVIIPAGHLVHAERPAEFVRAVLGFLRPD